jgi:hypothetical protein
VPLKTLRERAVTGQIWALGKYSALTALPLAVRAIAQKHCLF